MKIGPFAAALALMSVDPLLLQDMDSLVIDLAGMRKRLGQRGRWVVIYRIEDGSIRGVRCRRKSKARALAREVNGWVGRWRSKDWTRT